MELSTFLNTSLLNLDILCFSEHWVNDEQIKTLNIEHYKLAITLVKHNYGGMCTFVWDEIYIS